MATGYLGTRNEAKIFRKDYNANQATTVKYTCDSGYADFYMEYISSQGGADATLIIQRLIEGSWVDVLTISSANGANSGTYTYTINEAGSIKVEENSTGNFWTNVDGAVISARVFRMHNGDRIVTEVSNLGGGDDADINFMVIESNMTVTDITA